MLFSIFRSCFPCGITQKTSTPQSCLRSLCAHHTRIFRSFSFLNIISVYFQTCNLCCSQNKRHEFAPVQKWRIFNIFLSSAFWKEDGRVKLFSLSYTE
jgi:hypothetical protein